MDCLSSYYIERYDSAGRTAVNLQQKLLRRRGRWGGAARPLPARGPAGRPYRLFTQADGVTEVQLAAGQGQRQADAGVAVVEDKAEVGAQAEGAEVGRDGVFVGAVGSS